MQKSSAAAIVAVGAAAAGIGYLFWKQENDQSHSRGKSQLVRMPARLRTGISALVCHESCVCSVGSIAILHRDQSLAVVKYQLESTPCLGEGAYAS